MRYIKLYAYLNGNLGDDLMVEILLKRYPHYHFLYMGNNDDYKQLSSYDNFITRKKLIQKWRIVNRLCNILFGGKRKHVFVNLILDQMKKKAVCSVHIGGSIFIEHSSAKIQVAREREKMEGSPLFIIGANFGPYVHQVFLDSFRVCFRDVADVCFRDQESYRLFSELPNVRYAPDVVFNYKGDAKKKTTNDVIISVIDFHSRPKLVQYAEQYDCFIAELCRECINRGIRPVLMSFCRNEGDEIAVERIYNSLPEVTRSKTDIMRYQDVDTAVKRLAEAKFVVATRFHAMILALLYNVPFYSIAYDPKITNVLDDIGFESYCMPEKIGTLGASEIMDTKQKDIQITEIKQKANQQFESLDQYLSQFS